MTDKIAVSSWIKTTPIRFGSHFNLPMFCGKFGSDLIHSWSTVNSFSYFVNNFWAILMTTFCYWIDCVKLLITHNRCFNKNNLITNKIFKATQRVLWIFINVQLAITHERKLIIDLDERDCLIDRALAWNYLRTESRSNSCQLKMRTESLFASIKKHCNTLSHQRLCFLYERYYYKSACNDELHAKRSFSTTDSCSWRCVGFVIPSLLLNYKKKFSIWKLLVAR